MHHLFIWHSWLWSNNENENVSFFTCMSIFREIVSEFELVDVWRARNPNKKRFTWRRCCPLQQSRIDYFTISNTLRRSQQISKVDIEPGIRSDHSLIILEMELVGRKRGPGLWRFNNSLLDNKQVTDEIKAQIQLAKRRQGQYSTIIEPGLFLEVLLGNIRSFCI